MYVTQLLERPVNTDQAQAIGTANNQARLVLEAIRIEPDADRQEPHLAALGELRCRARRWLNVEGLRLPPLLTAITRH